MERFRPKGFSRLGFAAILANQVVLIISAILGAILTPIPATISSVVFLWWTWTQTSWEKVEPAEDIRKIRSAERLLGIPIMCGFAFSLHAFQGSPTTTEWILNVASMSVGVATFLAVGYKNLWVVTGKSG